MGYTTKNNQIEELKKKVGNLQTENEFIRKEIRRLDEKFLMKSDECAFFKAKCRALEDRIYDLTR